MTSVSLRVRLTIWCVVVVLAVVALFAADVVIIQRRISMRRVDHELEAARIQLISLLEEEFGELHSAKSAAEETCTVLASITRLVAILNETGDVVATNLETSSLTEVLNSGRRLRGIGTIASSKGAWRMQVTEETLDGTTLLLVVGTPLSDALRDQREIREAIYLAGPIALVLAAIGGLWLASMGLRPITVMARRAGSLPLTGVEDLGPPVRDDELGQLTRAFNALVARLRAALQTQRQFMADASHELRNPVSVIRTASDVALSREHRDEPEYREALAITSAQSRRLGRLVEDMLVLARADAGGYPLRPVVFFLDDVVEDCRRAVGVLAAERRVTVASTGTSDVAIGGDQELLRRLILNLMQNAVQHTPPKGTVEVDVSVSGGSVAIRVTDTGSGIPQPDIARIFDRFVQLDPSRRAEGAGLGLTIAKWIAEAHHGSLVVESTGPQGTTFCLALPAASQIA